MAVITLSKKHKQQKETHAPQTELFDRVNEALTFTIRQIGITAVEVALDDVADTAVKFIAKDPLGLVAGTEKENWICAEAPLARNPKGQTALDDEVTQEEELTNEMTQEAGKTSCAITVREVPGPELKTAMVPIPICPAQSNLGTERVANSMSDCDAVVAGAVVVVAAGAVVEAVQAMVVLDEEVLV